MKRGEGRHGGFFWGWESPFFLFFFFSPSLLRSGGQGGASAREPHTNTAPLGSNNTKTLAELAKRWQTAAQHWKTPTINDSLKTSRSWNNLLGMTCKVRHVGVLTWDRFLINWNSRRSPKTMCQLGVCTQTNTLSPEQEQQVS